MGIFYPLNGPTHKDPGNQLSDAELKEKFRVFSGELDKAVTDFEKRYPGFHRGNTGKGSVTRGPDRTGGTLDLWFA